MACQIKYSESGQIQQVLDSTGKESQLFKTIAKHPLVKNKQEALGIFKNAYSKKVNNENASFTHKTKYGFTDSYKEALEDTEEGGVIEIGLQGADFIPIITVEVTTNPKSLEGFINLQIQNGVLSEEKVVDPDGTYFQPKGKTPQARAVNSALLDQELKEHVGLAGFKRLKDNRYQISAIKPKETYKEGSVDSKIANELANSSMMRTFGSDKASKDPLFTEEQLKLKLLNLLNELGIKVTSISDYIEKYNNKNAVDPSARALADIAERVVAFQDGVIGVEELTEEVAHFIIEGFPQDQIESLLTNIHETAEWSEHASNYREIYSKNHSGEALEQAVRREVLGKVLANSLQNDFKTEQKQGTAISIIEKLKELFENLMSSLRNNLNPQIREDLNNFTAQVKDLLMRDELGAHLSQENFQANKFRFYNADSSDDGAINQIRSRSLAAIEVLKRQISDLSKTNKGSGVSKQQLTQAAATISDKLENLEGEHVVQSITTFLEVTRKQINYIESALKSNAKDEYSLSQEEVSVYQSLQNDLRPILTELRERVKKEQGNQWRTIEDRITASLDSINQIEGTKEVQESEVINKLVDRVIERHNLNPDEYKDYIKDWFNTAKTDTSYFHATFGQLIHAHDPLLSLAGSVIQDTMNEARINYLRSTKDFQSKLKQLGLNEKDLDQFFDKGYLVDAVDHKAFDDALLKMRMEVLQKFSKEAEALSIEELIRRHKSPSREPKNSLPKVDPADQIRLSEEIRKRQNEMVERVMAESYYKDQQAKYDRAGVHPETTSLLRAISQERGGILAIARKKDGTVDRTLLTQGDNNRLDQLVRDRKIAKTPFSNSGRLKEGLMENPAYRDNNLLPEYVLDPDVKPSQEAILSSDLHAIDALYRRESEGDNKPGVTPLFEKALQEAEEQGQEHALNFLRLNTNMSFTQEFWDSFGEDASLIKKLEKKANNSDNLEEVMAITDVLDILRITSNKRKNLMKIYQNPNNPAEIDVHYMDKGVREDIKKLTETLSELYSKSYKLLSEEDLAGGASPEAENTVNQAYKNALEDNNITSARQEIDFIKQHVTERDQLRMAQLEGFLKDYKLGLVGNPPISLKNYIEANIDLNEDIDVDQEIKNYGKSRILPYYKRLAPEGYSTLMNSLNSGQMSATEFVKEVKDKNFPIDVVPNYSYIQEDSKLVNPNYKKEYEGGYLQPKFGEYKNQKFEDMFSPKKRADGSFETIKNTEGHDEYIPTRNVDLYKGYEALKQYQRQNLEQIGEAGSHNLFKLPQISKSRLEKITSFVGKASGERIGEAWKDFAFYRVDEMERGAEFDGQTLSNSKIIPKYYTRDLENEDDLSTQLFTSYAAFAQQAYLHRARRNNIGDMFALREKLLTRSTSANVNKAVEATNTFKMFESYMDANFFGITEQSKLSINILGREVDLTKLARRFLNFIKFKNLGLSAIVPATSWLTAEVNSKIENFVEEHTNSSSARLAFKEYKKLAGDSAKEFMNLNSEAKLTVLGEFMGIFDAGNRFEDSSYNKTVRFGWKMGMGLHQAANFPVIPRLMLGVLYDNRVVDGNIVNFNDFKRNEKRDNPGISDKDIETKWSAVEDQAVYNYLDITSTNVEWKKSEIGKVLDKEGDELDKFLNNKLNGIQGRIEEASSNIDGSISQYRQVAASRHYLLNYFMTHRNWLTIATSRRFKSHQYNLQTGEIEEGSWTSAFKFVGDFLKDMGGANKKDFRDNMRDKWANANETERKNLRRVGIDIAVLNAMALLGFLIANAADDEENEDLWALQLSNYLYHRTMNETASSSLALPFQYLETLESPFVGLNTVVEMGKIGNYFDTEEIDYGKYRGMQGWQRQLVKVVPGVKQMREVQNPKEASDTYRFYNHRNFNSIPMNWFLQEE